MRRAFLGVPIVIALGLVAAACGGSSSSSSTSAPSTGGAVASTTSSGSAVKLTTKHSKFGTVLAAGPKQMTVYLFAADRGGRSNCDSACVKAWPPVTTSGRPGTGGTAVPSDVGTVMRANGTEQVTYKGHPLYYFIKDKDDGDAYGQGRHAFGADWYVVTPSGNKVDNS